MTLHQIDIVFKSGDDLYFLASLINKDDSWAICHTQEKEEKQQFIEDVRVFSTRKNGEQVPMSFLFEDLMCLEAYRNEHGHPMILLDNEILNARPDDDFQFTFFPSEETHVPFSETTMEHKFNWNGKMLRLTFEKPGSGRHLLEQLQQQTSAK